MFLSYVRFWQVDIEKKKMKMDEKLFMVVLNQIKNRHTCEPVRSTNILFTNL